MKALKTIIAVLALVVSVHQVNAASQITQNTSNVKLGVVSVTGATTVDEAVNSLSEKADKQGASAFKVISLGGDDKLFAVAEIYK